MADVSELQSALREGVIPYFSNVFFIPLLFAFGILWGGFSHQDEGNQAMQMFWWALLVAGAMFLVPSVWQSIRELSPTFDVFSARNVGLFLGKSFGFVVVIAGIGLGQRYRRFFR